MNAKIQNSDENQILFLEDYKAPSTPTRVGISRYWHWLIQSFKQKRKNGPFISDNNLKTIDSQILDQIAEPPSYFDLLSHLDDYFLKNGKSVEGPTLFVIPPCDDNNILSLWALSNGFEILEPPPRDSLSSLKPKPLSQLSGTGLIVIPELDRWFLRHPEGLSHVRDLLNQLSVLNRPFVVGCNSWAWEFLKKAVMAHLLLPPPLTFAPFDYKKLKGWFGHIAEKASEGNINFFNADDRSQFFTETEGSVVQDSYLNTLASESRGIPWIAWNLWRKSLRLERVEKEKRMEDEEEKESEKKKRSVLLGADRGVRVIWVEALASLHFPEEQKVDSLLVLHALLIHSRLTVEELLAVTPNVETTSVVPALLKAGIITLHAKSLMCAPAAYPQVRVHLEDAGFTMDQI